MRIVTINIFSKSNLYPIIFAIFWFIRQNIQSSKLKIVLKDKIYYVFVIYFSEMIAIFGYYIIKYRTRKKSIKKNSEDKIIRNNNNYKFGKNYEIGIIINNSDYLKDKKLQLFFLILLSSVFDMVVSLILSYSNIDFDQFSFEVYIRPFQIIINSFLTVIFLKLIIHRHQILSFIIIVISGICLFISDEKTNKLGIKDILIVFSEYLLGFVVSGFLDIIETKILNLISPYLLLFFKGIIGIFIIIIVRLINGNFDLLISNILNLFNNIYIIIFILSSMLFNLFFELTLQFLTPTHTCIGDSFSSILIFLFDFQNNGNNIFRIVGYILLFFGCLVFNEFIILNVFNLNKNTKYEISKRGDDINNLIHQIESIEVN